MALDQPCVFAPCVMLPVYGGFSVPVFGDQLPHLGFLQLLVSLPFSNVKGRCLRSFHHLLSANVNCLTHYIQHIAEHEGTLRADVLCVPQAPLPHFSSLLV